MKFTLPWTVCRICLQKGKLYSMFTKVGDDMTIGDKIALIGDIKVFPDKRLPQKICKKCAILLNTAYTFRMKCKKSDYILQLFLDEDRKKKKQTDHERKEHTVMTLNNGKVFTVPKGVTLKFSSSTATNQEMVPTVTTKKTASGIMTTAGKIIKIPKGIQVKYPIKSSPTSLLVSKIDDTDQNIPTTANADLIIQSDAITVPEDMLQDDAATESKFEDTGAGCNDSLSQDSQNNYLEIIEMTIGDVENNEYAADENEEQEELPSNGEKSQPDNVEQFKNESSVSNNVISEGNPFDIILKKKIINVQEKDRSSFICESCGNTSTTKKGFDAHMRGHQNKKPASGITVGKIIKIPKGMQIKYPKKSSLTSLLVSKINDIDQNIHTTANNDLIIESDLITVPHDGMLQDDAATESQKMDDTGAGCDDNLSQDSQNNDEIIDKAIEDIIDRYVKNDECMEDSAEENEEEELPSNGEKSQPDNIEQSKDESPVINNPISEGNPFEKIFKKKIIYVQKDRSTFICELCGYTYRSKTGFDIHMRGHRNEKPFECELCGVAFIQNSKLTAHMRRHTGEKPFKCDYCDRKFYQKESKLKHERIHTGEKPYECDMCSKSFSYACVLSRHKLLHTNENEKNFICPQCGKRFRFKYHLNAHLKTSSHQGSETLP